jgi:hypothetical protein
MSNSDEVAEVASETAPADTEKSAESKEAIPVVVVVAAVPETTC